MLDCGHEPIGTPTEPHDAGTPGPILACVTGTAHTPDGRTICHPCAEREEVANFATARDFTAYMHGKPDTHAPGFGNIALTTWTGATLATGRTWRTRSGFGRERWYFNATDANGNKWHGSGPGFGMYCRMRRAKVSP